MAVSTKDALYNYFAQSHFNKMPPEQMVRFRDYITNKDYTGNMRWWKKKFMHQDGNDWVVNDVPDFTKDGDAFRFEDANWNQLYDWIQRAMQAMYTDLQDGKYVNNIFVKPFIEKWFGPGKIFQTAPATSETEEAFDELAKFLENYPGLEKFLAESLTDVFDGDLTYQGLIDKLKSKEYNTDFKFRKKANRVATYIVRNGPQQPQGGAESPIPNRADWPLNVGYSSKPGAFGSPVIKDVDDIFKNHFNVAKDDSWINKPEKERFELTGRDTLVDAFKVNHREFLDKLLSNSNVRKAFAEYDTGTGSKISEQLEKALKETGYDDTESQDYVTPKYTEERSLMNRIKKFKDDKYEEYFKKFFEPTYGSRIYYSTYAQTIAKAFDKVKLKPSEGIEGIVAKKDDIIKEINKTAAGKAAKHFDWFIKRMEEIKKSSPQSYADALRNPHQMREVVSQLITKALNKDPADDNEAKTAMELLAVARYGIMTSRTRDAISEGLKDVKLFSDGDLSWNKNENVKFVTGAIDWTLKSGIKTAAFVGTGLFNIVRNNRKRKFNHDISDNKDLNAAYKAWQNGDTANFNKELVAVDNNLNVLANGLGASKISLDASNRANFTPDFLEDIKSYTEANKRFYEAFDELDSLRSGNGKSKKNIDSKNITTLRTTLLSKNPSTFTDDDMLLLEDIKQYDESTKKHNEASAKLKTLAAGLGTKSGRAVKISADVDNLEKDLKRYDELMVYKNGSAEEKQKQWREKHSDKYKELIAYWDMLDTFTKTHWFRLGSIKVKREQFLAGYEEGNSAAQDAAKLFAQSYDLRSA